MKTHLSLLTTLAIGLLMTAAGCFTFGLQNSNPLAGTSWKLETYAGQPLLENTTFTAHFQEGDIRGTAGCNQYFASYSHQQQKITIAELGWTEMACLNPEGVMDQEQSILGLLSEASTYQREGDVLRITTRDGKDLIFTAAESP